ncbi:MAG: hypothetical protein HY889_02255 [Deltaproteobacteria bacterium]|nr:hypothetical protein [Deltaproteobacteria bacterium]
MEIGTNSVFTGKIFPSRFYDSYFVNEYGKLESLRASRYNTCFSIILISVERAGKGTPHDDDRGEGFLRKLASTVADSVRNCDIVGLADDSQILIILPETDYFGSLTAVRKLTRAVDAIGAGAPLSAIVTQATFPKDGRGFGELVGTASKRVALKRESLWEKLGLKDILFWEIMGRLTATAHSGFNNSCFEAGGDRELTEFFIDQLDELIVKEISRGPQKRGVLYFSSKKISQRLPLVKNLNACGAFSTKVFLVGEPEDNVWEIRTATPLLLDDPRLKETFFTFYLNEGSGYALICKENWGATYSCFHTADPYLVEGLITKFQTEYSLQEQLG